MSETWADDQFDKLEAAYDEVPIAAKARIAELERLALDMRRSLQAAYHVNMLDFPTPYDERMAALGLLEGDDE